MIRRKKDRRGPFISPPTDRFVVRNTFTGGWDDPNRNNGSDLLDVLRPIPRIARPEREPSGAPSHSLLKRTLRWCSRYECVPPDGSCYGIFPNASERHETKTPQSQKYPGNGQHLKCPLRVAEPLSIAIGWCQGRGFSFNAKIKRVAVE